MRIINMEEDKLAPFKGIFVQNFIIFIVREELNILSKSKKEHFYENNFGNVSSI